ncbi:MAG TPA: DUF1345 domain-containing protein [Caulobacteraceae bacterium]|nr:DUF1345 domain-containing protein [Caulobacteraceae bacterium]
MMIHWRLALGLVVGLAAWFAASQFGAPLSTRALIGWNAGAVVYIAAVWTLFIRAPEAEVRLRAARQDEARGVITLMAIAAIAASLGGIVSALIQTKGESAVTHGLVDSLAALTLVTSWVLLQSIFVSHYAHRHYQAIEAGGQGAGFMFPGNAPRTYMDFAYLAICVGATAQISDPSVPTTPLRNLITTHAVTSFAYNTAVLALGINILSGLIGH